MRPLERPIFDQSREVEHGVEEHGTVAAGEDEAVAVEPGGGFGVVLHGASVEEGAEFGAAHGEAGVAGIGGLDRVHGQAAHGKRGLLESLNVHAFLLVIP